MKNKIEKARLKLFKTPPERVTIAFPSLNDLNTKRIRCLDFTVENRPTLKWLV